MPLPEIVSRGEIVAYLGLGASLSEADGGLIELLRGMVENEVRRYCGHEITRPAEPYVSYLPAANDRPPAEPLLALESERSAVDDGRILQLPHPFVRTDGLEVRVDPGASAGQGSGDFGDETQLTAGVDYFLDADDEGLSRSGQLIHLGSGWPRRARTVRATYFAGFTAAELDGAYSDVKLAVLDEVALRFRQAKSRQGADAVGTGSIRSESIGGEYSVTYAPAEVESPGLSADARQRLAPYVSLAP